jgi:hypothetical protein
MNTENEYLFWKTKKILKISNKIVKILTLLVTTTISRSLMYGQRISLRHKDTLQPKCDAVAEEWKVIKQQMDSPY